MAESSAPPSTPPKRSVPSELLLSEKWDTLLERVVVNAGYGLVFGGAASLVLFRGRGSRIALAAFSAGVGVGAAVERSSADFRKWH
mmetsp:Transcript_4777/g.14940  ORF Transcript_4777/g.14940 Transcript_4777/m.14940 type:complete len:86 (+) Transcript_4777:61-318(+)